MAKNVKVHPAIRVYEATASHGNVWAAVGAVRLAEGGCHVVLGLGETLELAETDATQLGKKWWEDHVNELCVPQMTGQ